MTIKAPKKLGLLDSLSQRFKSILSNPENTSESSLKPASKNTKSNLAIQIKDGEKSEIATKVFSSEKFSLPSLSGNEQDKTPNARLLNSPPRSLQSNKSMKPDKEKGDLGLGILPESFTDIPIPKEHALYQNLEFWVLN